MSDTIAKFNPKITNQEIVNGELRFILSGDDEYTFFGDRIEVDENDHSIYQELINRNPNRVYKTIGWDNTKELLKRI